MPYNHDEKSVLISIIVPVYNKERSLQNCIDSLDAQTIDKSLMEVILVNDGSTDESLFDLRACCAKAFLYTRFVAKEPRCFCCAQRGFISGVGEVPDVPRC